MTRLKAGAYDVTYLLEREREKRELYREGFFAGMLCVCAIATLAVTLLDLFA